MSCLIEMHVKVNHISFCMVKQNVLKVSSYSNDFYFGFICMKNTDYETYVEI